MLQVNEQRNILHAIRKRKANWIGHILRRNCLLKQVIEGKIEGEIEVTRRQGRRRKKLLDGLKDRRGYSHLKEEALDRSVWRNRFGRGFEPVVRLLDDDDDDTGFRELHLPLQAIYTATVLKCNFDISVNVTNWTHNSLDINIYTNGHKNENNGKCQT